MENGLSEAVAGFVEFLALERRLRPRTVEAYEAELVTALCYLEAAGLGPEQVSAAVTRPLVGGDEASPKTQNHRLAVWRTFGKWLVARHGLDSNPAADVEWAKVPRDRRRKPVLGAEETRRLVAAAGQGALPFSARDAAIAGVLWHTGLRLSELVALDLRHVGDGEFAGFVRKGGAVCDIPLNSEAAALLRAWTDARARISRLAAKETALFVSRRRRRMSDRAVQQMLAAAGEAAGLPMRVTPHLLRHSYCTALLKAGVAWPTVQRLMDHSRVSTTAQYAHPGPEEAREAVERLASAFKG